MAREQNVSTMFLADVFRAEEIRQALAVEAWEVSGQ